ncbi:MAG: hypothetical protein FJX74_22125, partial [Armatimonadetes bacterium]|nr:hypothetical protein [Armatimonadota bacterium]
MATDEVPDEVTGRPVQAVQDLASLTRDWLRRVWSQRSRAEWAVAWYLPLMTAAAAMVVALV